MVDPELGDAADGGVFDDIGSVQTAAQPYFKDAGVCGMLGEGEEGGGGSDFEEAGPDAFGHVQHAGQIMGERFVADQLTVEADAFVEADEMGRGEHMDAPAVCFERGAQEGAGRAFAVGACDMEDGRQRAVRIAQPVEQAGDTFKTQYVRTGRQRSEPIQLRLDRRVVRNGVVGHGPMFLARSRQAAARGAR